MKLRLFLVVGVALVASALAGVWSAMQEASAAKSTRATIAGYFPDYPDTPWMDMGGSVHVDGQPRFASREVAVNFQIVINATQRRFDGRRNRFRLSRSGGAL